MIGLDQLFNLRGPDFLLFYFCAGAASLFLCWVLHAIIEQPSGSPEPRDLDLQPYEMVALAKGEAGAFEAALVNLINQGYVEYNAGAGELLPAGDKPPPADMPIERRLFELISETAGMRISQARRLFGGALTAPLARLRDRGLVLGDGRALLAKLIPSAPFVLLFLIGMRKIEIGETRGRPTGFLTILCLLTVVVIVAHWVFSYRLTRKGRATLAQLRTEHDALRTSLNAGAPLSHVTSDDLVCAVGLFGLATLAGTELDPLVQAIYPPSRSGSGWGGSGSGCGSSCGSSCGGGCGGGCGGCGG